VFQTFVSQNVLTVSPWINTVWYIVVSEGYHMKLYPCIFTLTLKYKNLRKLWNPFEVDFYAVIIHPVNAVCCIFFVNVMTECFPTWRYWIFMITWNNECHTSFLCYIIGGFRGSCQSKERDEGWDNNRGTWSMCGQVSKFVGIVC